MNGFKRVKFLDIRKGDWEITLGECLNVEDGHGKTEGYRLHTFRDRTVMTALTSDASTEIANG